jgi:glycerol-3-phosphate acyltransferase PlsX
MTSARKIALDAMGGDNAPAEIVNGALQAIAGDEALSVDRLILVGDSSQIEAHLESCGGNPGFEIVHASEVVGMAEDPRKAMRGKPDNSISKAASLLKRGEAVSLVSMGNTGMVVAASTLVVGRLPGIRIPSIAVTVGLSGHPMVLMDMGANVDATPENLFHNGLMGAVYAQDVLGIETPRLGLLNVGEEAEKGPQRCKEAHALLSASELNFIGNVEGGDVFAGKADVIVTDGFTGNIILKLLEQFGELVVRKLLTSAHEAGIKIPAEVASSALQDLDYAAYGGALLLGINGIVIIGHGRSDARAVSNALKQAARAADSALNEHIIAGLNPSE